MCILLFVISQLTISSKLQKICLNVFFYRFCMKCSEENLKYFPTETQQELSNIIKK